jgi:activator of HSP90 ATPase
MADIENKGNDMDSNPNAIILLLPYGWNYVEAERLYWSKDYIERELTSLPVYSATSEVVIMAVPLTEVAENVEDPMLQPLNLRESTIINYMNAVNFIRRHQIISIPSLVVKVNGEYQKPKSCHEYIFSGAFDQGEFHDVTASSSFSKAMEHYNSFEINLAAR